MHDALLGIPSEVFWRCAVTVLGAVLTWLLKTGVGYLRSMAQDISQLKTGVALIMQRSDSHAERLKALETAVFSSGKNVS